MSNFFRSRAYDSERWRTKNKTKTEQIMGERNEVRVGASETNTKRRGEAAKSLDKDAERTKERVKTNGWSALVFISHSSRLIFSFFTLDSQALGER